MRESESEVAQSCLTLSDPMDYSLPGSSIHGIFQARVLEWGAIASSDVKIRDSNLSSGFPGGSAVKNPPAMLQETWVRSLGGEDPLDRGPYSVGNPMDRGAWRASPQGRKESDKTEAT